MNFRVADLACWSHMEELLPGLDGDMSVRRGRSRVENFWDNAAESSVASLDGCPDVVLVNPRVQ